VSVSLVIVATGDPTKWADSNALTKGGG
jgi:hypothetical protein